MAAAKATRLIYNTAPLNEIWELELAPGAAIPDGAPDAYWQGFVEASTGKATICQRREKRLFCSWGSNLGSVYHPVGTCAMLPQKWGGVVSPELIVYGTSNVRVIGALFYISPYHDSGLQSLTLPERFLRISDANQRTSQLDCELSIFFL